MAWVEDWNSKPTTAVKASAVGDPRGPCSAPWPDVVMGHHAIHHSIASPHADDRTHDPLRVYKSTWVNEAASPSEIRVIVRVLVFTKDRHEHKRRSRDVFVVVAVVSVVFGESAKQLSDI